VVGDGAEEIEEQVSAETPEVASIEEASFDDSKQEQIRPRKEKRELRAVKTKEELMQEARRREDELYYTGEESEDLAYYEAY